MDKNPTILEKMQLKSSLGIMLIVLLLGTLVALFILFFFQTHQILSQGSAKNLQKIVELSRDSLRMSIENMFVQLEMIAGLCDNPSAIDAQDSNWVDVLAKYETTDARMGVADTQGKIYYSHHESKDISDKAAYQRLMQGENVISAVLEKDLNGQDAIVLGVPIFKNERVVGAVCIEYTTRAFGDLINTKETQGIGATMVFQRDGKLVASYSGMEQYQTIYQMFSTMTFKKGSSVQVLQDAVAKEESGIMFYANHEKPRFLYHAPMGIRDWHIVTVVDAKSFEGISQQINTNVILLFIVASIILVVVLLLFSRVAATRKRLLEELQKDPLTGVLNRKRVEELIQEEIKKNTPLRHNCCLFIDIDDFKKINDTLGHLAGDEVLRYVACLLKSQMREEDFVCRYGGDEFCIWLWNLPNKTVAANIANRLLEKVRRENKVQMSIGIAFSEEQNDSFEAMVNRADQALYKAKQNGKNQFEMHVGQYS